MRFIVITLATTLALLAISQQRDADAAIDAQQTAAVAAIAPLNPAVFDPAPKDFPTFSRFKPYQDEFAAVSPLADPAPSLPPVANLPPLKLLDLAPINPSPEKAAPEAAQRDATPADVNQQAALSRQDLSAAFLMPGEDEIVFPEEPALTVELSVQPPRRPRAADRARVSSGLGRIAFATPTLAPMGHTLFCLKYPDECRVQKAMLPAGPITLTDEHRAELKRINAEINSAIHPMHMNESIGAEKWLIGPKVGDCNDYAVTKRHKLLALGWPSRDLLLAEVVTTWGEHHLVLVVRTDRGDIVADSLEETILNWAETPYRWVRVQSPENPKLWATIERPQPNHLAMAEQDFRR